MRLKTFDAPSMQDAMQRVRAVMGEEAIILSAVKTANGKGVRVTAAIEGDFLPTANDDHSPATAAETNGVAAPPPRTPKRVSVQELRRLESLWHFHGLPEVLMARLRHAAHFTEYLDDEDLLPELVGKIFTFEPRAMTADDTVMLVGPPAMGKTLTAAKIAAHAVMEGRPVQVITTDSKRAGGIEQLKAFTDILGLELHVTESAAELDRMLEELPSGKLTVIDNAGTNIFDDDDKRRIGQYIALVGVSPMLVLGTGIDAGEAQDIARTFAALGASHLICTRTDTARRLGGVLCAAVAGEMSLSHHTHSPRAATAPEPFNTRVLSALLLGNPLQGDQR